MKIGLINPNKSVKDPAVHLGLGYLASYALERNKNLQFNLLDTRIHSSSQVMKFLNTNLTLVGITASSQVFKEAISLAKILKAANPSVYICLGGPHASIVKSQILKDFSCLDFTVSGEGERTFCELITSLHNPGSWRDIKGLIFRDAQGSIIENPQQDLIGNLDDLPFPAYHLFPMEKYPHHRIITSRGCPYNCVFCNSKTLWTNKWRKRSPENILREIQLLIENYRRKPFTFNDDSFNIDLHRVEAFCNTLIEKKLNIIWGTSLRIEHINSELARKMRLAGCYNVSIGIESANNEVLRRINKRITSERIFEGIQIFRGAGIDVNGQFMIGNPGDTLDTIKESISFAKSSGLTTVEFYPALPFPETSLWNYSHNEGSFLCDDDCTEFHNENPRIIFETSEFPYQDRLQAIQLAKEQGFYHAVSTDTRSGLLDACKNMAIGFQRFLGPFIGNAFYILLRKFYRLIR